MTLIETFLKSYKDGNEVYLSDKERDEIVEEIERLHSIIEEVREYIENAFATGEEIFKVEILEILEKEN